MTYRSLSAAVAALAIVAAAPAAEAASSASGEYSFDATLSLSTTEGVTFAYEGDGEADVDASGDAGNFAAASFFVNPVGELASPDDSFPLTITGNGTVSANTPGPGGASAFSTASGFLEFTYVGEGPLTVMLDYFLEFSIEAETSAFPSSLAAAAGTYLLDVDINGENDLLVNASDGTVTDEDGIASAFSADLDDAVMFTVLSGQTFELFIGAAVVADSFHEPSTVPLPAGGALMLTGLVALGLLRRRG